MIALKMMKEEMKINDIIKATELPREEIEDVAEVYDHDSWLEAQISPQD